MATAELIGLLVLIAVVVMVIAIAVRRTMLVRAGGFDVSWRRRPSASDRGWTLGQGRYEGRTLSLYRAFSPLPVVSLRLDRAALVLDDRREAIGAETDLLPAGSVIVRCHHRGAPLELALSAGALTGLRSWIESRPPGSRAPRNTSERG